MIKWRGIGLSVLVVAILWIWIALPMNFFRLGSTGKVEAYIPVTSSSFAASPAPSSTTTTSSQSSNETSNSSNTPILVALISLASAVIVALIGGMFIVYQVRRNVKLLRELERERTESQTNLERERIRAELERIRFQDRITAVRSAQEQERQRKEMNTEASVVAMRQAQTAAERAQAYRNVLHADPHIARLQILDMSQPLEVTSVFVRVRLHQETRLSYELEPTLLVAEAQHDPNALLQAGLKHLESRMSTSLEPDEAIRTYGRCIIVGDPGAGKSTLLKYLTLKSVDKELPNLPDFPILIELNDFAISGHEDLLDFISTRWNDRYGFPKVEAYAFMEEHLASGNALLLLDALDETVIGEILDEAEASYRRVTTAIMELASRYHNSPIVVTARKAGYRQRTRLEGFTELEVLDFRPEDIQQFVINWFACHPNLRRQANAENLNIRLERNPRIQALAANPLLLALIVIVYEAQLDLPDRRAELYKQCVDTLLIKWDASRDIRRRREFKPEHKQQLLREVAWYFHNQGQRYFLESELLRVIADFLPAIGLSVEQDRQVLAEIAAENGLLKEQAQGWHGFLHLTLQEYFVAQYAIDHNELDTLLVHLGDPWWEEVLLLYVGQISDASSMLQKLIERDSKGSFWEDIFHMNLIVAGRCLAARPTVRQTFLREKVISRLFDLLTKTPYSLTRQHVVEVLTEVGGNEVNKHLLRLLSDKQVKSEVRRSIARTLGELGERSVIPDLLRLLSDKQVESDVRQSIARTLGELGERSVIPDLLRLLSDEQVESDVRDDIALALGELGERSVVPDLLRLLSDEQVDGYVRFHIARALIVLDERSIVPDLLRLIPNKDLIYHNRQEIVEIISDLSKDVANVRKLAVLLRKSDIADEIHSSLWTISLRMRVRIFLRDWMLIKLIKVVKW
jgi:GTPase SAR1 family protein